MLLTKMSTYCYSVCDCYECRRNDCTDEVLEKLCCRVGELEKKCLSSKYEIVTSVETPFEEEGTINGAVYTVSGYVGYTVYACQPMFTVVSSCNPGNVILDNWGKPIKSKQLNCEIVLPIGQGTVISEQPLVGSLNGITEIILESVTITRPVIGNPLTLESDVIIGVVPPIGRPLGSSRTVELFNRTTGQNAMGFPSASDPNPLGNIIDRILLIVANGTGHIILKIFFRSPQEPPVINSYTSTKSIVVSYSIKN